MLQINQHESFQTTGGDTLTMYASENTSHQLRSKKTANIRVITDWHGEIE